MDVEEIYSRHKIDMPFDTAFTPAKRVDPDSVEEAEKHSVFFGLRTMQGALIGDAAKGLSLDMTTFEFPEAMRRGGSFAAFSVLQAPSVYWKPDSVSNRDYWAAIADELTAASSELA